MSIAHWHLPNRYVTRHRTEELAKGERNEKCQIVAPSDVRILPYVEEIEEWSTVDGDAEQLDHCYGHRKRQLAQHHFALTRDGRSDKMDFVIFNFSRTNPFVDFFSSYTKYSPMTLFVLEHAYQRMQRKTITRLFLASVAIVAD